ncbi:type II secretory pathway protein [Prochlorococcus marinus XMU1411]|uniref:type II secretion system protein GspD n=1 Tax=Prochlorococcus marinus TaxID=1219 RepID=UPI001ADC751D|nr:type II secretory pathway protein [Prochlorococcus marinus]MBO8243533.1 type II secretory pathway protein [Prochlorococcus marinus XMU1411]MBW3054647.1 type II secretory pathway protein [Prochlorococcus marinus str. MU1411]MCR8538226.1 type II secretory pathway protein [Prochlorococcus marinus CUG1430]
MYPQRKSIQRSIVLLVFTCFFGAPNIAQELLNTKSQKKIFLDNSKSFLSELKISNKDNFSRNQLISSSIINPNLLDIEGPKVSLVFKQAKAKEIFEYLAKIANYGFVWVKNNPNDESKFDNDRLISMTLNDETYKKAFNSLLLASGLQAKLHDNVLYVGPNVRNTVFTQRATDVYQLNQISASSAADYLANLGASVTKTFTITTSVTSGTSQSQAVQGSSASSTTTDQSETSVKVYGASIGPLVGLIATTDERLQTVTMVGEDQLINLAKSFLGKLDIRQKQVALSVKVLDVNLSDKNSSMKDYGGTLDDAFIIGTQGKIKSAFGAYLPTFPDAGGSLNSNPGSTIQNKSFFGLLEASIENGSTKVLASPTLLLSESKLTDAGNDKGIGRKIGSEGFVVIGDKVPVDATQGEGGACSYSYDTVGVSLGAKILGIDENNYVTFTMTPIVTGISGSFNVVGCGLVSKINNRRLDTGAIRIKDGETLVLTGIIQETDVDTTYKYPILGDIPLLGALFRSKQTNNDQRELIILVTPKVLDDDTTINNKKYDLEFISEDANNLYNNLNSK